MYDFLVNMWVMGRINCDYLENMTIKGRIDEQEKLMILSTPQL